MKQAYILTLDAGTTGVKCAAFLRDGTPLRVHTEAYPTRYPRPGWAQQRPSEQLEASVRAIRQTLSVLPAKDAEALVFTGTMNGMIPVDEKGEALYDNIIHSDIRTAEQVARIRALMPERAYYLLTGGRVSEHSGLPKYMWLKEHEPDIYRRAAHFVNIKDYLYGQATGRPGGTDLTDASLCGCADMHTKDWAFDLLRECDVDREKMPELRPSADVSGKVSAEFSRLTGLPEGLPAAVGAGDGACAAHGAR
ncbi:MAG: FGGY-family carbohydrate kinase, partial [Clostridia bacterium]|nr:FGGY-family carbohydrate kinase [Clostridia bacterium]